MNNKQEKLDAVNKLESMKELQKDFNLKKAKNNTIMLDTIPKLVCFAMVAIVFIQVVGAIVLMIIGKKNNINLADLFSQIVQGDIVTIGVSVIGIAVSVWVGLNIYLSLSKEESEKLIQKMELEIASIEKCLNNVESTIKYQKGVMWQEFINLLDSQRNENMLSTYFAYQFGRLIYEKENIDNLNILLIHNLMQYENEYISMTRMYENGEKKSCYSQSERLIKKYEDLLNENIEGSDFWQKTFSFYFNLHIADAKFYRNAVCLRLGGFRNKFRIKQMEEVCVEYEKVFEDISDTAPEYKDINSAKAYIKNTIGYTLDLINQYEVVTDENRDKNAERRKSANKHMHEAVNLIEDQFVEKKARYLRNLGLTYERLGDMDKAYNAYVKSIKEDMSDYKSWTTCGSIILKKFEKEQGIARRDKLLSEMHMLEPEIWKTELLKAKTQFEMSASEGKGFEDPYYKLIQVYTYLYMLGNEQSEAKKDAKKYMNILEMMEYTGGGSMYAYRNYYEAIGDIKMASKINGQIKATQNNDVEHMSKLYLDKTKNDEKEE
ncbi:MAG: hypothetical protein K2N01_01345 [Lachnospiraceae bacterium]|nr:hypothetical protein [Lachnospiraceae bacterium]